MEHSEPKFLIQVRSTLSTTLLWRNKTKELLPLLQATTTAYREIYFNTVVWNAIPAFEMLSTFCCIYSKTIKLTTSENDCDSAQLLTLKVLKKWDCCLNCSLIWSATTFVNNSKSEINERYGAISLISLFYSLFGLQNFCRDMEYYPADNLNSLIRWAVYAYGYDFDDCLNMNYTQLTGRLAETDWETSAYPRCKVFAIEALNFNCKQIFHNF